MRKLDNIKYTWKHKKAFLKIEKQLIGRNTLRGYLHDLDKLILYMLLSKKKVSKIHRRFARHYIGNIKNYNDCMNAIIDWECARYTKPDKPLSAIEFIKYSLDCEHKYYKLFLNIANDLGLKE